MSVPREQAGLIGRKIGMSQIFDDKDNIVRVTVVEGGPCSVLYKNVLGNRTNFALGFMDKFKNVKNPQKVFFDKINVFPKKVIKEFPFSSTDKEYKVGDYVKVDIFSKGDYLDIEGKTKGKGFQGVIKRHNFSRGPETHGSRYHRRPGSMGACADPSRVFKGKKLPGRMGGANRTVQNLELVRIDKENNLLLVKGAIPGPSNGIVFIKKAVKKNR